MQKQKLQNTRVRDVQVTDQGFNLEKLDPEIATHLKTLLPKKKMTKISFVLENCLTTVANGIRRTVVDEFPTICLSLDVINIKTNERFLKLDEFRKRVSLIPINQDIPEDAEWKISVVATERRMVISGEIMPNNKSASDYVNKNGLPFRDTFRLAELHEGKFLEIAGIKIQKGCGYENARHQPVVNMKYLIYDYRPCTFLNDKGYLENRTVYVDDFLKEYNKKGKATRREIQNARLLVIPDSSFEKLMTAREVPRLEIYDYTIRDVSIPSYTSSECLPNEFYMEFIVPHNAPPKSLMKSVCDNLISRLELVRDSIAFLQKSPDEEDKTGTVYIEQDSKKTIVTIYGETHTIGGLIRQSVFELNPTISLVNYKIEHSSRRIIKINIIHPDSLNVIIDSINWCIKEYQSIKMSF